MMIRISKGSLNSGDESCGFSGRLNLSSSISRVTAYTMFCVNYLRGQRVNTAFLG